MASPTDMRRYLTHFTRIRDLYQDFARLTRVCGPSVSLRWLGLIVSNLAQVLRSGNLQVVDEAMGPGPFRCTRGNATAMLIGPHVMGGIREIWCRDVYLGDDLTIRDGDTVVDLGANMGNFTILALAHGPNVKVIAVEPDVRFNKLLDAQLNLNGWKGRCTLISAFVGEPADRVVDTVQQDSPVGAKRASQGDILEKVGQGEIAFLKCDVEGGEYALFSSGSQLLGRTRQLAFELHYQDGDKDDLLKRLGQQGFQVRCERAALNDGVYHAVKRGVGMPACL